MQNLDDVDYANKYRIQTTLMLANGLAKDFFLDLHSGKIPSISAADSVRASIQDTLTTLPIDPQYQEAVLNLIVLIYYQHCVQVHDKYRLFYIEQYEAWKDAFVTLHSIATDNDVRKEISSSLTKFLSLRPPRRTRKGTRKWMWIVGGIILFFIFFH